MESQPTIAKNVSRPHQYKCGVCSEEGHNSRNCPLRTAVSLPQNKSRMLTPTKNGAADVMGLPQQHSQRLPPQSQQQQPSAMQMMHGDSVFDSGGRGARMPPDIRGRQMGAEPDAMSGMGAYRGPFAPAIASTRRRVLQSAEHVANVASSGMNSEDYTVAVNDLVSAMDCLERVVKCAMRFNATVEGNLVLDNDQDKKRRRKEFGDAH